MRTIPEESEPKKRNLIPAALGLGVAALVLSATVFALNLTASTTPTPVPVTRDIRLIISSVEPHNASMGMMMDEMHVYFPSVIVVNRGDTIVLTVVNMDEHRHGFKIPDLGVASDNTVDITPGDSWTKTFTVDRPGVFIWECNVPYVPASGTMGQDCGKDHEEMTGYLIVQ
ncbi:MAG TPA: hypothetical protein VI999_06210 [Thermoplasmata archaeon]|nr:hypothetical protein [Thermoplasmata archaeon]